MPMLTMLRIGRQCARSHRPLRDLVGEGPHLVDGTADLDASRPGRPQGLARRTGFAGRRVRTARPLRSVIFSPRNILLGGRLEPDGLGQATSWPIVSAVTRFLSSPAGQTARLQGKTCPPARIGRKQLAEVPRLDPW